MTPLDVIFAESADDDLAGIYQWIADETASLETGLRFVSRIVDRCEKIGDAPHGGRRRDDLDAGLRTIAFERAALIIYGVEDDRVVILNVLYRGRDVDAAFGGDGPERPA